MGFVETDGLKYYEFEIFDRALVIQGVFSRLGGVSPDPWKSLNLGGLSGDTRDNVVENRKRMFSCVKRDVASIYDAWQVHGDHIICTDSPRPLETAHLQADAIATNNPEVTLTMRFADCVPIFLFDPIKKVVALAHAGWKGTVLKIGAKTCLAMQNRYGSQMKDILAAIGPSIGSDHYEVGEDVVSQVREGFGNRSEKFISPKNENQNHYLDLWKANQESLQEIGVKNIEVAGLCTACDTTTWYSHRAEKGKTGRFGAIFSLRG